MKLEIKLGAAAHVVELARNNKDALQCSIDGHGVELNAIEVSPGVYSVLLGGRSFEVTVEPFAGELRVTTGEKSYAARVRDPRKWRRNGDSLSASAGRASVVAPMPGRVVRVLVKQGDVVETGQGIVVIEAMKMQNEVRSPKPGKVERLLVTEGHAINAGDTIAVIV